MKCRRRHEVRERFVSDGPACVQDMALEAASADYWWKRWSYQRGRWDDLYSDFGWEIEKSKGWEVRRSRHGEARIGGF
jgi:hypothetical protein